MKAIIATIAAVTSFAAHHAQAQQVHAILIADTADNSIGAGVKENLKNMQLFLGEIETVAEVGVKIKIVSDVDFSCRSIEKAVDDLAVKPSDAVVFYYSGHGFRRNNTQTQFPEFDCRRDRSDGRSEMAGVVNAIVGKKPRFVLAIADTCNVEIPIRNLAPGPVRAGGEAERKAGLRRLFLNYGGTLMLSGSVPGEYSWYMTTGPSIGGFFTNQFLGKIEQRLISDGARAEWERVSSDATRSILIPTTTGSAVYQHPQFATLDLAILQ